MYLRQVTAGGAELFPDVWNGIDADDIDSLVDEIEHIVYHLVKDNRVRIVQIPLVWIERRHDKFMAVLSPGKLPGAVVGNTCGQVFSYSDGIS